MLDNFIEIKKGGFMRKGFTLIEIILVLAIMSTIGGVSIVSIKYYKTVKNKVDGDYYCNAVLNFINNSKAYCRENYCSAIIYIDINKNEIRLVNGINVVKKLMLTNKMKIDRATGRLSNTDVFIIVDKNGYTNDACTIILKDNNSIEHEITMRVGTSYVKIKE